MRHTSSTGYAQRALILPRYEVWRYADPRGIFGGTPGIRRLAKFDVAISLASDPQITTYENSCIGKGNSPGSCQPRVSEKRNGGAHVAILPDSDCRRSLNSNLSSLLSSYTHLLPQPTYNPTPTPLNWLRTHPSPGIINTVIVNQTPANEV